MSMDYCAEAIRKDLQEKQRRNPRFSLRNMAKGMNVSQSFLSKILTGKNNATPVIAYKFGKYAHLEEIEIYKLIESTLIKADSQNVIEELIEEEILN